MILAIGANIKRKKPDGCNICIYNNMIINRGKTKYVCTQPFIQCANFRPVQSPDKARMVRTNPDWVKWHKEKEDEVMARRARGEDYKW